MKKEDILNIFIKKEDSIKILFFFIGFLLFILYPIIKFYNINEDYKNLKYSFQESIKREEVIKRKLDSTIKTKTSLEKKYKEDYQAIVDRTFYSPTIVKELVLKEFSKNNISLITQYRLIKEKSLELLDNEEYFIPLSIPYEISGSLNNFYNLVLEFENSNKFLLFNQHPISIEYLKNREVIIKFYISSIYFSQN